MLIKLIGLGFREYLRDSMNIFDGCIVMLSLIEIVLESLMSGSIDFSVVAAFRSLRIFRIFKLARSWASLRNIL